MKKLTRLKRLSVLTVAITIGSGLSALSSVVSAEPGFYLGGAYGFARVDGGDFKDDAPVLKAFFGGKFNSYLGVEGAIHDFSETKDGGITSNLTGKSLAIVGFLPLTDSFEVFVKGGNLWWKNDLAYLGFKDSRNGTEIFYGAGVDFYFSPRIALRLEMERYEVEFSSNEAGIDIDTSTDVDVASVGVVFNF